MIIQQMYDKLRQMFAIKNIAPEKFIEEGGVVADYLNGISEGKYRRDEDIVKDLYPDLSEPDRIAQSLRSLKSRATNTLVYLFQIAPISKSKHSSYFVSLASSKKEVMVAELLWLMQLPRPARLLASRVLKKANKFHLTSEKERALDVKCKYYSTYGPRSEFNRNFKQLEQCRQILQLEQKVVGLRYRLTAQFTGSQQISQYSMREIRKECKVLQQQCQNFQTRTIVFDLGFVRSYVLRFDGKFDKALAVLNESLCYFSERPELTTKQRLVAIYFFCLRICIQMKDTSRGVEYCKRASTLLDRHSSTWFQFKSAEMMLLLHTAHWQDAAKLLREVLSSPKFANYEQQVELWAMMEGYLRHAAGVDILPVETTVFGKNFSFHHVFGELELSIQDKVGMNVPVQLLKIVRYLAERNFDLLEARIKSFRDYSSRHFHPRNATRFRRTLAFVKILSALQSSYWNVDAIPEAASKHLEFLNQKTTPRSSDNLDVGEQIVEFIPYEMLCEQILAECRKILQEGEYADPHWHVQRRQKSHIPSET